MRNFVLSIVSAAIAVLGTALAAADPVIGLVGMNGRRPGGKFSGDAVEVKFEVRSPSGLPVDQVEALIDGLWSKRGAWRLPRTRRAERGR
jgi:hypothetical protein